jgi:hypothetical protein
MSKRYPYHLAKCQHRAMMAMERHTARGHCRIPCILGRATDRICRKPCSSRIRPQSICRIRIYHIYHSLKALEECFKVLFSLNMYYTNRGLFCYTLRQIPDWRKPVWIRWRLGSSRKTESQTNFYTCNRHRKMTSGYNHWPSCPE